MSFLEELDEDVPAEPEPLPAHWDPLPHERTYFRHHYTGDLGWMVRRDGGDSIRLDRPNQEIIRPYRSGEWLPQKEVRQMTEMQMAQIAFEADRALCRFIGEHERANREWLSVKEEKRIAWMRQGPASPLIRRAMWEAVMGALKHHVSDSSGV